MKKIVVTGDFSFSKDQNERLEKLGDVEYFDNLSTSEEWLRSVQDADVIVSNGDFVYENLDKLENVLVTYPYIELGNFDSEELEKRGVFIANTRGSNRNSIVEWVTYAILTLYRDFPNQTNVEQDIPLVFGESLENKEVLIVGRGDIGQKVGEVCEAFDMNVNYLSRGEDLQDKSKNSDLIINCLNTNPSSEDLLNEEFFMNLKKGAKFISFVRQHTYDLQGLIKALDADILSAAAIDCDPEKPGGTDNDFYQACLKHNKITVTPHIAFATKQAAANGKEFVVQNVEAWIEDNPKNVVKK